MKKLILILAILPVAALADPPDGTPEWPYSMIPGYEYDVFLHHQFTHQYWTDYNLYNVIGGRRGISFLGRNDQSGDDEGVMVAKPAGVGISDEAWSDEGGGNGGGTTLLGEAVAQRMFLERITHCMGYIIGIMLVGLTKHGWASAFK